MNQPPGGGYPPGGGGYPPGGGGGYGGGGYGQPPAPGGAPGGAYGQPPAPGGYGQQPPAPGGYGQPPPAAAPGYGPPPGGAPGYGQPPPAYGPPGGGYGPPGGGYGGGGGGGRAVFNGDGGTLLVTYLLYVLAPVIALLVINFVLGFTGGMLAAMAKERMLALPFQLLGMLIYFGGIIGVQIFWTHKLAEFYSLGIKLDGQDCRYTGTVKELAGTLAVNFLLTMITLGIYAPWMIVNTKKFMYSKTEVAGRAGRLTFDGDGGTLFGKYIVGLILTYCTLGIYTPWFANDLMAFRWENTKLDGQPFQFRKDPGGFFGIFLLNIILIYCTLGIYSPWAMCAIFKWEAEHVG